MSEIEVTVNGRDLVAGRDFYVLKSSLSTDAPKFMVVLKLPRPKARELSTREKLSLFFRGKWSELDKEVPAHLDLVSIGNWADGERDTFLAGPPEAAGKVIYAEDIGGASTEEV